MPMLFVESYEEFATRHGGNPVESRRRLVFSDGAQCSLEADGFPRKEPPVDRRERLALIREYHQVRVRQAESEFHQTRRDMSEMLANARKFSNLPYPTEAPKVLADLKSKVEERRAALAKVEAQIRELPEEQQRRQMEEMEARRQAEVDALHAEIMQITI